QPATDTTPVGVDQRGEGGTIPRSRPLDPGVFRRWLHAPLASRRFPNDRRRPAFVNIVRVADHYRAGAEKAPTAVRLNRLRNCNLFGQISATSARRAADNHPRACPTGRMDMTSVRWLRRASLV